MVDFSERALCLIFSLAMLGQAFFIRRLVGTWVFPAVIFSLLWFGYTFIPLILLFQVPAKPLALAFIFISTLFFSLGAVPFNWKAAYQDNQRNSQRTSRYHTPFLNIVYWIFLPLSVLCTFADAFIQGFSVSELTFSLSETSGRYAGLRYSEELQANFTGQFSLVLSYLAAALGGFRFDRSQTKVSRLFAIPLSLAPAMLVMVTQSAKGQFFLAGAFFYGALLASRISRGYLRLIDKDLLYGTSIILMITVPAVTFSFISRGMQRIDDPFELLERLYFYYASYSSAHVFSFSEWFTQHLGDSSSMHYANDTRPVGFYTFMGLFKIAGAAQDVPMGVYADFYKFDPILTSNIYSIFRGLILDFGVLGTFAYMFSSGFALHLAFRSLLLGTKPIVSGATFIFMIGYFYISYAISLLTWINIFVTFAFLIMVLGLNRMVKAGRPLEQVQLTPPEPMPSTPKPC